MSLFTSKEELDSYVKKTLSKLNDENEKSLRGLSISRLYFELGEMSTALEYVSSYLELNKESLEALRLQGECYEGLKNVTMAVKSFYRSIQIEPKQCDLIDRICDLIAANPLKNAEDAVLLMEIQTKLNVDVAPIFRAKLKNDINEEIALILANMLERPTDVVRQIRLIKYYMDNNLLQDAFRYSFDMEMQQNEFLSQSIEWYNIVSSVLSKCCTEQKTVWSFWLLSLITLERQCSLYLCEMEKRSMAKCANLLFEFDKTLSVASSTVLELCSQRELAIHFLNHYRGQLCLHYGSFVLERDRFQKSQSQESTVNALRLLLAAYNCGVAGNDEPWLQNSDESTKQFMLLWRQEGAFRCLQAGRTLLSCIDDDKDSVAMKNILKMRSDWTTSEHLVNQLRGACSNSDWRKDVLQMLFSYFDHDGDVTSSYLINCTEMDELNYDLPTVRDLNTYEKCAQLLRPSSLALMVYLCIGAANLSDHTCHTFNGLNLSTENLMQCEVKTLNRLDFETFLYATTIQAKRKLEMTKLTIISKPRMLPFANISSMLATEEQSNWWLCAYKVVKNIPGDDLVEMHQELRHGIKAVRGVGDPKMDTIIYLKLGKVLLQRSNCSLEVLQQNFLDKRTLALFKFSLHMIKIDNSHTNDSRLFSYANGQASGVEKQIENLVELAITHLAKHFFEIKDYDGCINALSNIHLPTALYCVGNAHRQMEKLNETPEKRLQMYGARWCFQETLKVLDSLNADDSHPLRLLCNFDLEEIEINSTNPILSDNSCSEEKSCLDRLNRITGEPEPNNMHVLDSYRIGQIDSALNQMMKDMPPNAGKEYFKSGMIEIILVEIGKFVKLLNSTPRNFSPELSISPILGDAWTSHMLAQNVRLFNPSSQRHTPLNVSPSVITRTGKAMLGELLRTEEEEDKPTEETI